MNPKATVYLETTIPSFLTARPSNALILAGQQQLTLRWWNSRKRHYSVFISELVIEEAGKGDSQAARKRIAAIRSLPTSKSTTKQSSWVPKSSKAASSPKRPQPTPVTSPLQQGTESTIF
jgi:hypothetical protein